MSKCFKNINFGTEDQKQNELTHSLCIWSAPDVDTGGVTIMGILANRFFSSAKPEVGNLQYR